MNITAFLNSKGLRVTEGYSQQVPPTSTRFNKSNK